MKQIDFYPQERDWTDYFLSFPYIKEIDQQLYLGNYSAAKFWGLHTLLHIRRTITELTK